MKRVLLSLVLFGVLGAFQNAAASPISGFSGPYDPSQWTGSSNNCDGNVNVAGVPNSLTITGCDNGSFNSGDISYTAVAAGSGTVSFAYSYSTVDEPPYDSFAYLLNGVPTFLAGANGDSGNTSFAVAAGDVFGFRVDSFDNIFGPGITSISDFEAPGSDADAAPVPEPASLTLLGLGLAGMGARRWRQRKP